MGFFGAFGDFLDRAGHAFGYGVSTVATKVGNLFVPGPTVVVGTGENVATSAVPDHAGPPGTTPSGGGTRDTGGTLTPTVSTGPSPFGPPTAQAFAAEDPGRFGVGSTAPSDGQDDPAPPHVLGNDDRLTPEVTEVAGPDTRFPDGRVPDVTEVAGPDPGGDRFPGGPDGHRVPEMTEIAGPDTRRPDWPDEHPGRIEWHGPGRDVVEVAGPDPGRDHDGSVFQRQDADPFQRDTGSGDGGGSSPGDDPPVFSAPGHADAAGGGHEARWSGAEEHTDQPDWHDHTDPTG